MEHILARCTQEAMITIWKLTREAWNNEEYRWPEISLGTILGCGNLITQKCEGQRGQQHQCQTTVDEKGATRLLQILISEAAHLTWVMRCERVIQEKTHTAQESESCWLKAINQRLTEDRITATKIKSDKTFTKQIKATWKDLLRKQSDLPDDWIQIHEVLVGRRAHRALPR